MTLPFGFHVGVTHAEPAEKVLVYHVTAVLGHGSDRELGVAGCSEFVRDEHVDVGSDPLRDFDGDRYPSAGHSEHEGNHIRSDHPLCHDGIGEAGSGVGTISIPHEASVPERAVASEPMRRLLLLANPSASGFTGGLFRDIVSILSADFDLVPEWPNGPDATRERSAAAALEGFDVVAAMGGDGVVHHVANGLARSTTALAIIPAGTTNVLSRIFRLPRRPKKAAAQLAALPTVATRLAHITAATATGSRSEYATFAIGIGYDADVVELAERRPHSKIWLGGAHYASSAVSRLLGDWRTRPANLSVQCSGDRVDGVTALVQVHHPYTYFGPVPLHITPHATPGMAALVADDLEVHRASEIFARAVLRRPIPERLGTRLWGDVHEFIVDAEPPALYQADGELLGRADRIEVTPVPDALRVLRDPT